MLSVAAALCVCAVAIGQVSARSDTGNFLDDKWLSGRWDKFRDEVEEPGTWTPGKPFDQALDPAKDPCLKVKCGRHKVCVVTQDDRTATCVSQRRVSFKDAGLDQSPGSKCKQCPVVHPSPVCGSDGHSYSTKCKLDYQACISGKKITVKCPGLCPCPAHTEPSSAEKKECSESELKQAVSGLRDWFRVLYENSVYNKKVKVPKPDKNRFEPGAWPVCKEPLGWMFSRLDTDQDVSLDRAELGGLYPDRGEPCADTFLRSCDTHAADGRLSAAEWCTCFQRHTDSPCKSELSNINKKQAGKKLLGQYLPTCDEEGYYRSHQCHSSSGQCWCVDRYGNEVAGSRTHGPADCGVVLESSGDQGSGDLPVSDDEDEDGEDSFAPKERAVADDEDDGEEEEDDVDEDEYLS